MNLDERARHAASAVREQADAVDREAVLERIERRSRRRPWIAPVAGAATVAAVVVALVAVALPALVRDRPPVIGTDGPAVDVPSETVSPDAPPGAKDPEPLPGATVSWGTVALPDLTGEVALRSLAVGGDVIVAVGTDAAGPSVLTKAAGRSAVDPAAWARVATDLCGEASCELHDVAASPDGGFVVVGSLDGLPKLWTSPDGATWRRVDLQREPDAAPAGESVLTAVGATPTGGLVALGSEATQAGRRPIAFTTTDAGTWVEQSRGIDFSGLEEAGADVVTVGVVGGRVVALGYIGDGHALWERGDDGWSTRELTGTDFGIITTSTEELVEAPEGLLIPGAVHDGEDEDGRVWRSDDGGATWTAMEGEFAGPRDQHVSDIVVSANGTLAVGHEAGPDGGDPRPRAWLLIDGTWQHLDGGAAFERTGTMRAAARLDDERGIAVGTAASGEDAVAWVYHVERVADPTGCRAGVPEPDLHGGLPELVADRRAEILEAAESCDLATLGRIAADGPLGGGADRAFTYSFGGDDDPVAYWRRLEEAGQEPLRTLASLLHGPYAQDATRTADGAALTVYVWPAAAAEGGYVGWRTAITADGEWLYFVAGD